MHVVVETDQARCLSCAQQALWSLIPEAGPLLLLVSGGSCLELLTPHLLTQLPKDTVVAPLDERYSLVPGQSNSLAIAERITSNSSVALLDHSARLDESLLSFTERIQSQVSGWLDSNPESTVIATMGIGEDGHTAGILPLSEAASSLLNGFFGYDAGDQYPGRVTATFEFLRTKVDHAICYAVGEQKRAALHMFNQSLSLREAPCRIILEMPDVQLFTDQASM